MRDIKESGLYSDKEGFSTFSISQIALGKYGIVDGPFGSNLKSIHYRDNGIPIIQSGFVTTGKFFADKYKYVEITKYEEEIRSSVSAGDLIIAKIGAKAGTSALLPENHPTGIIAGNCIKITPNKALIYPKYFAYLMGYFYQNGVLKNIINTTAQPAVSMSQLKRMRILIPPLPEQKKISEILSCIDQLIEQSQSRVYKLEVFKKGCIEEFITHGIEQKHFKNSIFGFIPNHWEVKKFKEITNSITCGIASTPKYVPRGSGVPFLSAQNVQKGEVLLDKFKFVSREFHLKLVKNTRPQKGDILYSRVGAGFGEAALIKFDWEFSTYVSLTLIKIKNSFSSEFYKYFLNSFYGKRQAKSGIFAGGGVPNLNVGIVQDFDVIVPPKEEQQIIVNYLNSLEVNINQEKKKIIQLKTLRAGLSQDLLSGRKRVRI